jgi:hypothetical protein
MYGYVGKRRDGFVCRNDLQNSINEAYMSGEVPCGKGKAYQGCTLEMEMEKWSR